MNFNMQPTHLKKTVVFCFMLFSIVTKSQINFNFKISKPYCVFNFMETAIGLHSISPTFKDYIISNTKNDNDFKKLCEDYSKINLDDQYKISGFPVNRFMNRSNYDLISMNAVNATTFDDFKQRNIGLISISENIQLIDILKKAEVIYDKLVWKENGVNTEKQLKILSKYKDVNASIYEKFNVFYKSTWTNDIPFQVAIFPILGNLGSTISTAHINSLCISVLTKETNFGSINGVVLHEMCHILYQNQSAEFQNQIDQYFKKSPSNYAKIAYSYFNEALATALGNGWANKKINGKLHESEWYYAPTINDFAKIIYPMVEDYLLKDKVLDAKFIDDAIQLFSKKFPNSIYNYEQSVNKAVFYCDDLDEMEVVNQLTKYFNISGLNLSSPILDPISLKTIIENQNNQFFIIDNHQNQTIAELSNYFLQLKNLIFEDKPLNLSFIDDKKRTIIILILNSKNELDAELKKMKQKGYFSLVQPLQNYK